MDMGKSHAQQSIDGGYFLLPSDQWGYLWGNPNLEYGRLGFAPSLDRGGLNGIKIV
jgi:hypothetical protein